MSFSREIIKRSKLDIGSSLGACGPNVSIGPVVGLGTSASSCPATPLDPTPSPSPPL